MCLLFVKMTISPFAILQHVRHRQPEQLCTGQNKCARRETAPLMLNTTKNPTNKTGIRTKNIHKYDSSVNKVQHTAVKRKGKLTQTKKREKHSCSSTQIYRVSSAAGVTSGKRFAMSASVALSIAGRRQKYLLQCYTKHTQRAGVQRDTNPTRHKTITSHFGARERRQIYHRKQTICFVRTRSRPSEQTSVARLPQNQNNATNTTTSHVSY